MKFAAVNRRGVAPAPQNAAQKPAHAPGQNGRKSAAQSAPELDQFFTHPGIAKQCWKSLQPVLRALGGQKNGMRFIEPGAGDGAFYDLFPGNGRVGVDIAPRRKEFIAHDFLTWTPPRNIRREHAVVVGNPPFGLRADMAVKFFNRAAEMADTVAFIVPVIFRKYFIHKKLAPDFCWIYKKELPRDAFWTDKKAAYSVNTEFQVWTRTASGRKNMRLFSPPPVSHDDFVMHQYNNTREALKVFGREFDFAVPCQGWQDYSRRETDPAKCEKNKQWMLFAPANGKARARLYRGIDYGALAQKNTTCIPGFRKGDVVHEYGVRYG